MAKIQPYGDAYRFVKRFTKTVKGILPKKNLKASPGKTLFYSPDYKVLYDEILKETSLELLNTAEMVLANFDFQSIDDIDEVSVAVYQDAEGKFFVEKSEYQSPISTNINPSIAENTYMINDKVVSQIDDKLNNPKSQVYKDILSLYGRDNGSSFIKYLPKYDEDGKPFYDLKIQLDDIDISGVIGYNIFIIEEED